MLENGKKYWKSRGILSVRKSGNRVRSLKDLQKDLSSEQY